MSSVKLLLPQFVGLEPLKMFLKELQKTHPVYFIPAILLVLVLLYMATSGKKKKTKPKLSAAEIQERIKNFQPEALCPPISETSKLVLKNSFVVEGSVGKQVKLVGEQGNFLNFATMDFLNFGQRKEQLEAAHEALNKYGCGSCGPRGFYGTIDVHVNLEDELSKFFNVEQAIVYSDASSTIKSVIPAFSNKNDRLVVDEGCNASVLTGVKLSRAKVTYFKHNDIKDLERVLMKIQEEEAATSMKQRRFIVVEGIYSNYGDIAPLPELMELKVKYKWRICVDESLSIGAIGRTGKGLTEHFGVPVESIDLHVGSLSTTFASIGGFCAGSTTVVEHQRLNGAGYCYSASSPPFVSTAAIAALKLMQIEGEERIAKLQQNTKYFKKQLLSKGANIVTTTSDELSPLFHVRLVPKNGTADSKLNAEARYAEQERVHSVVKLVRKEGVLVTSATYSFEDEAAEIIPVPSIKVVITSDHTTAELDSVVSAIVKSTKSIT
mmetsp:Transcript_11268/g.12916  ORF Transcript_11268/g.12916 Transcript_11268/m.12916 type:complete len:494 (+) Transcript_11268:257-1738(+)|eukprot:CAMPEP_0184028120 /NCGR_PEP_ID=MMETSP0954-20121128/14621_1 /TAXON_ID=627963 /ORGANISM="Aplanochytrium sp, Strain PBS07" /LENGTH=493 /DNA_ID=CAMNT_0026312843 /DNA_START=158 /DNA_END=1639 /DNA_ORIENTATION=-